MVELKIRRGVFLTKVKRLFEPPIANASLIPSGSPNFKNAVYITFLLGLNDIREREIYKSIHDSNKWYMNLLKHVINSDIAKLTADEKMEISKMLDDKLKSNMFLAKEMVNELAKIKRLKNQAKLYDNMTGIFSFPIEIEDVYIKNILLGVENRSITDYLSSIELSPITDRINDLKTGKKFNEAEIVIFETFSSIKYVLYSSEMETLLMNKIPRYAQYVAMKVVKN